MDGIAFAHAVIDGDGIVDKWAYPVAHLASQTLKRNAEILIDDGGTHTHIATLSNVA